MTAAVPRHGRGQRDRRGGDDPVDPVVLSEQDAARVRELRTGEDWAGWLRLAARFPGRDLPGLLASAGEDDAVGTGGQKAGQRPEVGPGGVPPGLWDALAWLARREGFAVDRVHHGNAASSVSWHGRRINIRADLDPRAAAQALVHELGHVLLHDRDDGHPPGASTAGCRGTGKVEADSVAFVVSERFGLDTSGYAWPYLASWAGSDPRAQPEAAVMMAARHITTAAATITGHLDAALFGRPAQPEQAVRPRVRQPASAVYTRRRSVESVMPGAGQLAASAMAGSQPAVPARAQEPVTGPAAVRPVPAGIVRVLGDAERFYLDCLPGSWVPGYLAGRGLPEAAVTRWRIGYAPSGWTSLTTRLRELGHHDDDILAAGLARRSSRGNLIDYFRDRVMLPVRAPDGAVAGFIARAHPDARAGVPRYLNSPGTAAYVKGDLLFGLHEAREQLAGGAVPVLAEGPFDAIAVTLADPRRYAGLAPCGTALTSRQVAALASACDISEAGVIVALDGDRAGRDAAVRAYGVLSAVTSKAVAVTLPPDRDPASILQADGAAALQAVLRQRAEPLASLVIDAHLDQWSARLGEAEGQLGALRSAASLIASMLPPDIADQILGITGGRRLDPVGDDLRPIALPELPEIARLLPVGAACQITRVAERLGTDLSDVTAEVASGLASEASTSRRLTASARDTAGRHQRPPRVSDATHVSAAGFPTQALVGPGTSGRSPPRPRPSAQAVPARSASQRALRI